MYPIVQNENQIRYLIVFAAPIANSPFNIVFPSFSVNDPKKTSFFDLSFQVKLMFEFIIVPFTPLMVNSLESLFVTSFALLSNVFSYLKKSPNIILDRNFICPDALLLTPVYALCAVLCYEIECSAFCDPVQVAETLVNNETASQ